MRIQTTAQEDFAVGLKPSAPQVVTVAVTAPLALRVEFEDDTCGTVQFLASHLTGVFEPLRQESFFSLARVERGAVMWPGPLDLAPDAMYAAIHQTGAWILA